MSSRGFNFRLSLLPTRQVFLNFSPHDSQLDIVLERLQQLLNDDLFRLIDEFLTSPARGLLRFLIEFLNERGEFRIGNGSGWFRVLEVSFRDFRGS